jgi:hypothetical protein
MSALGQKRRLHHVRPMSALPPKADIVQRGGNFNPAREWMPQSPARRADQAIEEHDALHRAGTRQV